MENRIDKMGRRHKLKRCMPRRAVYITQAVEELNKGHVERVGWENELVAAVEELKKSHVGLRTLLAHARNG